MARRKNAEGKAPLWLLPWELLDARCRPECRDGAKVLWRWSRGCNDEYDLFTYLTTPKLIRASKVLEFGAKKYELDNWMEGFAFAVIASAGLRHALSETEFDEDEDGSGMPHLWHLDCNVMFAWRQTHKYAQYEKFDNRDGKDLVL